MDPLLVFLLTSLYCAFLDTTERKKKNKDRKEGKHVFDKSDEKVDNAFCYLKNIKFIPNKHSVFISVFNQKINSIQNANSSKCTAIPEEYCYKMEQNLERYTCGLNRCLQGVFNNIAQHLSVFTLEGSEREIAF